MGKQQRMTTGLFRPNIRAKLLGWFLLAALIPLGVVGYVAYIHSSSVLQEQESERLKSIAKTRGDQISDYFNEKKKSLSLLAWDPAVIMAMEDLVEAVETAGLGSAEHLEVDRKLHPFFKKYIDEFDYHDFFLIASDGTVLFTVQHESDFATNLKTGPYKDSELGRVFRSSCTLLATEISDFRFYKPSIRPAAFLTTPVLRKGKLLGAVALQLKTTRLHKLVGDYFGLGRTGEVLLVSRKQDRAIFLNPLRHDPMAGDQRLVAVYAEWSLPIRQALAGKKGQGFFKDYRGERVLAVWRYLPHLRVGMVVKKDAKEAFARVAQLARDSVLVGIIALLGVLLIAVTLSGSISRPIVQLTEATKALAEGDLTRQAKVSSGDEIGELARGFNRMTATFQGVIQQAKDIASGDFSAEFAPRSKKDTLGLALNEMTRTLRQVAQVAGAVAHGDYDLEIAVKGEHDQLGQALALMSRNLNAAMSDARRKINYLDNIPGPTLVFDLNHTVQFINRAACAQVHLTREQCLGRKCYEVFNNGHCQTSQCQATQAIKEDAVCSGVTRWKLLQGEIPIRYFVAPIKDRQGEIVSVVEYVVDISDEMKVAALAEQVSRGEYTVKLVPRFEGDRLAQAINRMTQDLRRSAEADKQDRWLKTGKAALAEAIQGQSELPALAGRIVSNLVQYLDARVGALYVRDPDGNYVLCGSYAHGGEEHLKAVFTPGEGLVGQAVKERQSLALNDVPDHYFKVRSALGEAPPRAIAVHPLIYEDEVQGVLELGAFEPFSQQAQEFMQTVSEGLAVALHSAESRHQMKELLAETRRKSEALQQQSEELRVANEELEEQTEALRRSEEELKSQQAELQATNEELEEKSEYLANQKAEIEHKNTEIEKAKLAVEANAQELARASQYKSEFLANMSHELRTPLNSLLILSKVLAENEDQNLSADQVKAATVIQTSGQDLLNLINDILDLSKVEAGMLSIFPEGVRLEDLARGMQGVFEPVAVERDLAFSVELDQGLPDTIFTDGHRVEQILRNLLSNAFKFTRAGSVSLRIHLPGEDAAFQHIGLNPQTAIVFSVADTGIGIPLGKQTAIFDAFQQADGTTGRSYGGTGLGLAISRELARLLGGEIHVQSQEGKGSCFSLYMTQKCAPLLRQDSPHPALIPAEGDRPPRPSTGEIPVFVTDDREEIAEGERSILIIEDDVGSARVLMDLSRDRGYKSLSAGDGESGLRLARRFSPTAIILDMGLPDMDGLTVLEELKKNPATADIPVQIISSLDQSPEPLELGAIGYLTKPASLEAIDAVFLDIEQAREEAIQEVLVMEDDPSIRRLINDLLQDRGVSTTGTGSGREGIELIRTGKFDCVILDLKLEDMMGVDVLREIHEDASLRLPPVVIYTGRELSHEEHQELRQYTSSIIIKGADSHERLLDETTMFLHSVETTLGGRESAAVKMLHDPEQVLQGRKVLLVDDDMRNTFALSSVLQKRGIAVVMADNGQMSLDRLAEEPDIDLIIMDIMMPVMDGYEAMEQIRKQQQHASLPIIALTAKAMPDDRARCIEAGANDYLTKPVDTDKLLAMMKVWLYKTK